jgi:hypothetical protein
LEAALRGVGGEEKPEDGRESGRGRRGLRVCRWRGEKSGLFPCVADQIWRGWGCRRRRRRKQLCSGSIEAAKAARRGSGGIARGGGVRIAHVRVARWCRCEIAWGLGEVSGASGVGLCCPGPFKPRWMPPCAPPMRPMCHYVTKCLLRANPDRCRALWEMLDGTRVAHTQPCSALGSRAGKTLSEGLPGSLSCVHCVSVRMSRECEWSKIVVEGVERNRMPPCKVLMP